MFFVDFRIPGIMDERVDSCPAPLKLRPRSAGETRLLLLFLCWSRMVALVPHYSGLSSKHLLS